MLPFSLRDWVNPRKFRNCSTTEIQTRYNLNVSRNTLHLKCSLLVNVTLPLHSLLYWITISNIGLVDWLIDWLIDWKSEWVSDWLVGSLIDRSIDRSVGWLVGWLIGWLVDRSISRSTANFSICKVHGSRRGDFWSQWNMDWLLWFVSITVAVLFIFCAMGFPVIFVGCKIIYFLG